VVCWGGLLALASILLGDIAASAQDRTPPRLFRAPADVLHISQTQAPPITKASTINRQLGVVPVPENPLRPTPEQQMQYNVHPASAMQEIVEGSEELDGHSWQERRHIKSDDALPFPVKLNAPDQNKAIDPVDDPFGDTQRSHSVLLSPGKPAATRLGTNRLPQQSENSDLEINGANGQDLTQQDKKPQVDEGEEDFQREELPPKRKDDRSFETDCDDVAKEVASQTLLNITLATQPILKGDDQIPSECPRTYAGDPWRCWPCQTFTFTASSLCHKPLYFEDIQLERYGHSAGPLLQPFKSTAHFFVRAALLPYQMGINPPNECQYALGYYRPGDCAPWLRDPFPISPRGLLYEAGFAVGAAFLIP
jgi:hypothetical protein